MRKRLPLLALLPILTLAPLLALLRYCWCIVANPAKAWRIAIGYDQLANVAANGHEDETISSRAARARQALGLDFLLNRLVVHIFSNQITRQPNKDQRY